MANVAISTATANRVTPLREPVDERSWEEAELTRILTEATIAAADYAKINRRIDWLAAVGPRAIFTYLIRSMDWFIAERDRLYLEAERDSEPEPFEAWLTERWLREMRSEAFQASAEFQYLYAEWERER